MKTLWQCQACAKDFSYEEPRYHITRMLRAECTHITVCLECAKSWAWLFMLEAVPA